MIGVRRAQRGYLTMCLRPGGRGGRMRVDDAPDIRVALIQDEVRWRVGRWAEVALDDTAVFERHDHELLRAQHVVRHAARLDHQYAGVAIDAACISERERYQAGADQAEVRTPDLLPQVAK